MTSIGRAHDLLASLSPRFCLDVLTHGNLREHIRRALCSCGRETPERRCPLHPVLVFWLILALPLYRARSIANVFMTLVDGLRPGRPKLPLRPVTDGALAHARQRLGVEPVRRLFEAVAEDVDPEPTFHGRRAWAIDACSSTVPDRPENEAVFGRHRSCGPAAFPHFTTVVLASTRTHELKAASWIPHRGSEREVAWRFLPHLGKQDLLLLDRGYYGGHFFHALVEQGTDFLARARTHLRPITKQRRGPGDYDVVIVANRLPAHLRGKVPSHAVTLRLRMIEYTLDGKETIRLLTSLTSRRISPRELIELYHERWDVELSFDEIKTHLLAAAHGHVRTVYRGRTPAMVEQEFWASMTLYTLVRGLMARAARAHGIDPRRISFVDALLVIKLAACSTAGRAPQNLLKRYERLLEDLAACELDRWRRPRQAPRVIKVKSSKLPRKRRTHRSVKADFLGNLRLGAAPDGH